MDEVIVSGEIYADKDEIGEWSVNAKPWKTDDERLKFALEADIDQFRANKPQDRSDKARHYAIVITELEKAYAYFKTFVLDTE